MSVRRLAVVKKPSLFLAAEVGMLLHLNRRRERAMAVTVVSVTVIMSMHLRL